MVSINPTQSNVQSALLAFMQDVLPGVSGQSPAVFTGTITGTTLTVTALPNLRPAGIQGQIQENAPLLGKGVMPGTTIIQQLTGQTGGLGTYEVAPSQTQEQSVTMSTGVAIIAGQGNRVPEPANPYFAVLTPMRVDRFATNVDTNDDVKLVGSIAGTVLTVTEVLIGEIVPGSTLFGTGVAAGTEILSQINGSPGGDGIYNVTPSQTAASATMSAGSQTLTQSAEWTVQIDFHADSNLAGDFAMIVSTALRDEYGVDFFAGLAPPLNGVVPLYADDPKQVPFINDSNQYEWRFSLDACLQVYQSIAVPRLYADSADVTVKDVNALFPP